MSVQFTVSSGFLLKTLYCLAWSSKLIDIKITSKNWMRRILLFAIVGKVQSKPIRNYRIEIYRLPSRLIKYISDISQYAGAI